jgi:Na+/proline symporter
MNRIVEVASYGAIHRTPAMILSFMIVAAFVLTSGIRGVAWVSVLKVWARVAGRFRKVDRFFTSSHTNP